VKIYKLVARVSKHATRRDWKQPAPAVLGQLVCHGEVMQFPKSTSDMMISDKEKASRLGTPRRSTILSAQGSDP
jgi:hypothetical protein